MKLRRCTQSLSLAISSSSAVSSMGYFIHLVSQEASSDMFPPWKFSCAILPGTLFPQNNPVVISSTFFKHVPNALFSKEPCNHPHTFGFSKKMGKLKIGQIQFLRKGLWTAVKSSLWRHISHVFHAHLKSGLDIKCELT
ncbi:hypothetical protein AAY473_004312 [Plecturocebus cupreus]